MWEIDCENKLLSVYDYPIFSWQGISFQLDLVGTQFIIRDFPFRFRHENEYVRPRADLVMDTGSPELLVYLYAVPDSMMRLALSDRDTRKYACPSKNGVTPTLYLLHEYGLLDRNLWIEHRNLLPQWHISGEREMIVAGMDFLKSFNLRLYPAKHRIELIPIAHVSLQEDQSRQKGNEDFRIRAFLSREGDAVVDFVKEGLISPVPILTMPHQDQITRLRLYGIKTRYSFELKSPFNFQCLVCREKDTHVLPADGGRETGHEGMILIWKGAII